MNEKDLLQKINEDSKDITPPDSLSPEAIEQMLLCCGAQNAPEKTQNTERNSQNNEQTSTNTFRNSRNNEQNESNTFRNSQNDEQNGPSTVPDITRKKKFRRSVLRYGSLAAVLAVAFTAFWQYQHISVNTPSKSEVTYSELPDAAAVPETELLTLTDTTAAPETELPALTDNTNSADSAAESSEEADSASESFKDTAAAVSELFTYPESYEEIYQALREHFSPEYGTDMITYEADYSIAKSTTEQAEMMAEDSTADSAVSESGADGGAPDFSGTNLQEQGVDEGDIVKTDGNYIYVLRQNLTFAIIKASGKDSELVSTTDFSTGNDASIREMYLDGDSLHIILNEYVTSLENDNDIYYTNSGHQARIITYDISDRSQPVQTGSITQDGIYQDSRKNGSYLYLFTSYSPDICDTYEESMIVPRINGTAASPENFYLPETLQSSTYLIISSMDTAAPDEIIDSKILVSGASDFYVSTENIYIANQQYNSSQSRTEITKFHYADGTITGAAAGSVKGYLNDSFSMNEYEGMLRVVTTYYGDDYNAVRNLVSTFTGEYYEQNWTEHNALYILDESLQQTGAIEGLAEGETIRSARFFGDTGYFVTFRETDPLFSVDLSDPANPQILGELKISGFSSYLHFYGEDLLLGIGYEADEETGVTSGLKLSMFDISDPSNVTEIDRFVIPGITWCPAIEDYKSILVQPEKNLIGFYCDNRYMVFSYDSQNGFTRNLLYDFYSDMLTDQAEYNNMRGLYIKDDFYLAGNTFLISFDMKNDFEKENVLTIDS